MNKPRIVFFGSGPVAAKSLGLLARDFEIEAVITKPATVKEMAAAGKDLCIYSVNTKKELDDLISSGPFQSKLAILIDFGIIVSSEVIGYFPKGIINSHFSLLPEWRGADPITFAILSGQTKTGVSLMLIDEGMDTGRIIRQKSLPISPDDTTATLTDKLIELSGQLLKSDIPAFLAGDLPPRAQPHPDRATYSRKLTKEDGRIDWHKPAAQIEREIRAFKDWPKSYTTLAGKDVIITKAHVLDSDDPRLKPGDAKGVGDEIGEHLLFVQTGNGSLVVDSLKPAGKSEMSSEAFLAGYGKRL